MINKILDRYILKEIAGPFFIIITVFTLGITSGNMLKLSDFIINKGIKITTILKLVSYLIPYLLSFTVPMALLTAILLTFGRLSQDNEITALKASGVNLFKIISPVLWVALLFSFFNLYINDKLVADSHFNMRMLLIDIGYEKPEALIEPGKFINAFENYIFYFRDIKDNELKQIIIYEIEKEKTVRTITAKRGVIEKSTDKLTLRLYDGTADEPDPNNPNKFYKLFFKSFPIPLQINKESRVLKSQNKRLKELTLKEIKIKINDMVKKGINSNRLKTEYHRKITFSFSCFVLCLIGLPLAIYSKHGEKTIGFAISLFLSLIYYILIMFATSIGEEGHIAPNIIMWTPNVLLGSIGLFMIYKVSKQ